MPTRFYIAEVVGSGVRHDPYRAICAEQMKHCCAAIPTDERGVPLTNTCVVKISDDDHSSLPRGVAEIPRSDEFIAQALVQDELRKAGQRVERPAFLVATARLVDQVKELGGEFTTYELRQLDELLGLHSS